MPRGGSSSSEGEEDSFVDISASNLTIAMSKNKYKLPPIDPAVLANAGPWVGLLFQRFNLVQKGGNVRFDAFDTKHAEHLEQQSKTTQDVQKLQTDVEEMATGLADAHNKVDRVSSDLEAHKTEMEKKYNNLLAKFEAKSSTVSVQVPSLSAVQQCSVEDKFQALLLESKAVQTIFIVGKVPKARQAVSLNTLMQRHFDVNGARLLLLVGKSMTRRFSVQLEKVKATSATVRHYNLAIRDLSYWVVQDAPPALRKMNSNAYAFFRYAKSRFSPLRRYKFEAEDGYVSVDDVPFLLVYLVPTKQSKWRSLAEPLTELVADCLSKDWLETAMTEFEPPSGFTAKCYGAQFFNVWRTRTSKMTRTTTTRWKAKKRRSKGPPRAVGEKTKNSLFG
jgi:hypothetical protein